MEFKITTLLNWQLRTGFETNYLTLCKLVITNQQQYFVFRDIRKIWSHRCKLINQLKRFAFIYNLACTNFLINYRIMIALSGSHRRFVVSTDHRCTHLKIRGGGGSNFCRNPWGVHAFWTKSQGWEEYIFWVLLSLSILLFSLTSSFLKICRGAIWPPPSPPWASTVQTLSGCKLVKFLIEE